jgi:hypothetical protein
VLWFQFIGGFHFIGGCHYCHYWRHFHDFSGILLSLVITRRFMKFMSHTFLSIIAVAPNSQGKSRRRREEQEEQEEF